MGNTAGKFGAFHATFFNGLKKGRVGFRVLQIRRYVANFFLVMAMELPKTVAVLGLGISGCAVAEALLRRGVQIVGADEAPSEELRCRDQAHSLAQRGAELFLGKNAFERLRRLRLPLAIISPGISVHRPEIQALIQSGTQIWGELEFAYRLLISEFGKQKVCLIAVTGTKGKTTTAHLIARMLQSSGLPTFLGGNVGEPFVSIVEGLSTHPASSPKPYEKRIVLEVSSFQLATCETFRPDIAVLTALFTDHLDWHKDREDYRKAKAKIFVNQRGEDWAVLNADNAGSQAMASESRGRILWCGRDVLASCPYCSHWVSADERFIWASLGEGRFPVMPVSDFKLLGQHNLDNLMMAVGASLLAGANPEGIHQAVRGFGGVLHRLEFFAEFKGVFFVNDSAATMPDAAAAGIRAFDAPIVLIAGGRDKGGDWRDFAGALRERVKALVVMGEFAERLAKIAHKAGVKAVTCAENMEDAVGKAIAFAEPGDVVLLSPGCASFDQFSDYAQRGEAFKEAVRKWRTANEVKGHDGVDGANEQA